jgi:type VI secretion system protein ImpF
MSEIDGKKKLRPSLLDCLIDDRPEDSSEPEQSQSIILRQLRENVRNDLENLFNTRLCILDLPEEFSELTQSLFNYGLPDIATMNLQASSQIDDYCEAIAKCIQASEPRISSINVSAPSALDSRDRCFHFRVEATLRAAPARERVIFDSALNPVRQEVRVTEKDE